jgi:LacI family transcriptional regulator
MTSSKSNSPTIRDVARKAGVSVATISRFLNNPSLVSADTAETVRSAMNALNYVPLVVARNLATHKTNALGLMLTEIQGDFFTPMLKGIESVASAENYDLLISTSRKTGSRIAPPLGKHNTDGIMVFLDSLSVEELKKLHESDLPIVLIHQTPPDSLSIPCVTIENKSASQRLVTHLIEVHHRRHIGFLRGPENNEDSYWREMGYQQALNNHHIPLSEGLIGIGCYDRSTARKSTTLMIEAHPEMDAIFCGDDESAIGVLIALRDAGKKVPEDISVVGFDDELLTPYLTPPLTTVRAPTEEVGKTAASKLIQLIRTGATDLLTLLPTQLVIRRSCGCTEAPVSLI